MMIETVAVGLSNNAAAREKDPAWAAAKDLQTAFMAEFLKYGGLADVFSEGLGGEFSAYVLSAVAEEMTETSPQLAELFYARMKTSV
ncbi:MAG: hypothetical protein V2I43_18040 [Parvularcula sp.]|jgi:hypothetical protein|nr:hypothetical protein [Parvularcula sp.]